MINGVYVARGPSRFQNGYPEFDEIDVTRRISLQKNSIAVLVCNDQPSGRTMAHPPGLWFDLEMEFSTSKSQKIVSDHRWRGICDESFRVPHSSWGSIVEDIDATRISGNWMHRDFDDSSWPFGNPIDESDRSVWPIPVARRIPLLREREVAIREAGSEAALRAGDEFTWELDQTSLVYSVFDFDSTSGTQVSLTYLLPDGYSASNHYIARDGRQEYTSGDTFACRWIKLRILKGSLRIRGLKTFEVLYPFERIGRFQCNDDELNRLWNICVRSLELLSEDAYVDCADRERVEWMDCEPPAYELTRLTQTGPGSGQAKTSADSRLMAQLLRRTAFTQTENGCVKAHMARETFVLCATISGSEESRALSASSRDGMAPNKLCCHVGHRISKTLILN
jgi:hypothetical protein